MSNDVFITSKRGGLKDVYYNILKICPLKLKAYIEILRVHHKIYSDKNPKYFSEKVQWLKIHHKLEQFTHLADKYAMREYVKERIGEDYLVPLLGVWDDANDIDFSKLPNHFVLKANHGQGYNIVCRDKEKVNTDMIRKKLEDFLKEDYSAIKGELQYKSIPRKIICEQYMEDETGELSDYKFYCQDGVVKMFAIFGNRSVKLEINYYYPDKSDFGIESSGKYTPNREKSLPIEIDEMKRLATELSKGIPFVRVDFYLVQGKIYIGELTLTPGGGSDPYKPLEKDLEISSWVDLEKY